jgi:flotillin
VALDRMLIDQLPEIVEKAARGLSGANLTVLNGADGLGQVASGLVSQGLAIFDTLRGGIAQYDEADDEPSLIGNPGSGSSQQRNP